MIVSRIIGGLGNQMFQYAAGRALSLSHGVDLNLDVSGFASYELHQGFELTELFNPDVVLMDGPQVDAFLGWKRKKIARKVLKRLPLRFMGGPRVIEEPHFHYWPKFQKVGPSAYLSGFWQTENYFKNYAGTIRQDFRFTPHLDDLSRKILDEIVNTQSVSVHIRRGDYASNSKTTAIHGLIPVEYYAKSIKYLRDRFEDVNFFTFSDDIAWAKSNLSLSDHQCTFVSHNAGKNSWRDMMLMSHCQHNIIANSSFSWWGAWLNSNQNKIVLRPKNWFATPDKNTSDITPREWISF